MDVPSFLVASTANIVVGQRLVRKVCQHCITSYTLTKRNIEELERQIDFSHILDALEKHGAILSDGKKSPDSLLFFRGKGCKQCNDSGYKGRIGIYEILDVSSAIKTAILSNATPDEIMKVAIEEGMITMLQDGFMKAKNGTTTVEEVLRVTKE